MRPLGTPVDTPPTHLPPPPLFPPVKLASLGDSLTYGTDGGPTASYRRELSRLLTQTGQPHTWIVDAWPGKKCSWWVDRLDNLITQVDPDMIFLSCGVNDTPTDNTEADYRTLLAIAASRGVQVIASVLGPPDMLSSTNTVRPYIIDWMRGTRNALRRAIAAHPEVPFADLARVPSDPEWLQEDGIHLTKRAEDGYARLFYEAACSVTGWRLLEQMYVSPMCGLGRGHWPDEPRPVPDRDYVVCRSA